MARTVAFDQDQAIEKALDVFWRKGYNGTSMRDLTDAMQINSSSLYNTLGDKHQLFVQCIKHYTRKRRILLEERAKVFDSPQKALESFIHDVADVVVKDAQGCFAIKTAFEVSPDNKGIQALLKDDNDFTHTFLSKLIREAVEQGVMKKDTDPDLLADYIISTYTGWYELYILHKDPAKIKQLAAFMVYHLLR
ncbi:MAG: TetR/AcrR family transcriptional regulator [Dyadobacter sp.]|uniref:TetR/AcrR family transcriptional regulator n=1 Tax=Dyadobacter sp. TaxID=1914288 RepID=UPI001B00E61F|nr:TetR/AcrR family transcriptional regulator [Dyadobacter sp.]MBO9611830.1 TetR/AcrR family transcriptional regulator [Dyadobacter sp.]